jgi:hypothetical protein
LEMDCSRDYGEDVGMPLMLWGLCLSTKSSY